VFLVLIKFFSLSFLSSLGFGTLRLVLLVFRIWIRSSRSDSKFNLPLFPRTLHTQTLIWLFIILVISPRSIAVSVNITIDDSLGDPTTGAHFSYEPQDSWTLDGACDRCTPPDSSSAHLRTWHQGTFVRGNDHLSSWSDHAVIEHIFPTCTPPKYATASECSILW
jgi:hypothetical protein